LKIPAKGLAQAAYRLSPEKPEEVKAAGAMVVLRGGARLAFDAADRTFEFLTAHGPLKLAAADLRCIELDTPGGGLHQAVFRNGSVLAGLMPAERIQLKLQLGLPLDVARQEVRRLLLTAKAEDTKSPAMLTLRNEDVLAGEFADESWKVHTEFGPVSVTPPSVVNATFSRESTGQVKLLLRDGTRIGGKLAGDYIRFRIQPGPELKIHVGHRARRGPPGPRRPDTQPPRGHPAGFQS